MRSPVKFTKLVLGLAVISVLLTAIFVVDLVRAWRRENTGAVTCTMAFQPLLPNNGYVELLLKSQQPIESYFDGGVFINLVDQYGTQPMRLTLVRSAGGTYARSIVPLDLQYQKDVGALWMKDWADLDFINIGRPHRYFPFDSASFDFDLSITPPVDLRIVRITNRVPGFLLACNSSHVTRQTDGSLHVALTLSRSPLVQLTAVTLCLAATAFLILIIRLEKVESLATAVASFFFSLWSIRAILAVEIKVVPTLLDCYILTLCTLLLFGLGWRVVLERIHRRSSAENWPA